MYSTSAEKRHNARFSNYATFGDITIYTFAATFRRSPKSLQASLSFSRKSFRSCLSSSCVTGAPAHPWSISTGRARRDLPSFSKLITPAGRQGAGVGSNWVGEIITSEGLVAHHYNHNVNIYACAFGAGSVVIPPNILPLQSEHRSPRASPRETRTQ